MDLADHIEDLAKELANNHAVFGSFAWSGAPDDRENWAIIYTKHRDSDVTAESNAHVFEKVLNKPEFADDAHEERHSHWAVGWIKGWVIRVYRPDGTITDAFKAYAELELARREYPILDEDDHSRRENEEADRVWRDCYRPKERLEYIREHRDQFDFQSFADMLGCVRGAYFAGYASELISG